MKLLEELKNGYKAYLMDGKYILSKNMRKDKIEFIKKKLIYKKTTLLKNDIFN